MQAGLPYRPPAYPTRGLAILVLELPQASDIGHLQAAVLRLQLVKRRRAEAVLAANLHRRQGRQLNPVYEFAP
jgi:hypothetical protein